MTFPAMRLAMSDALEDGHTAMVTDLSGDQVLFIGTRPLPEHRAEARRIVREGMADILAWLGQPVESPTGRGLYKQLRRQAMPVSSRDFPESSGQILVHKPPAPISWAMAASVEEAEPFSTVVLQAQKFGYRERIPLHDEAAPNASDLASGVARAIRRAYESAGQALKRDGYVADITHGYPLPELQVELSFKAWPAVPGITVPAAERDGR